MIQGFKVLAFVAGLRGLFSGSSAGAVEKPTEDMELLDVILGCVAKLRPPSPQQKSNCVDVAWSTSSIGFIHKKSLGRPRGASERYAADAMPRDAVHVVR